ncbi:MAG: N-6 DNA methylase [Candidatus Bathyarchaeia archaeon]|nr:N-6 DNA methylase [Candidatus Bathyarchaeia archaeon]
MSREAEVESKLHHYIFGVLEKRGFTIDGVRFDEPKTQYPVSGRRADVAVVLAEGKKPLLIIETKRKYEERGYFKATRKIMPTSRVVIDQALWYAMYSGAPYFATTNGRVFALFRRPEAGERFSFDTHRIIIKERVVIDEEFAEEILVTVARLYRQVPVAVTPLDWSFIIVLRDFVNWLSEAVEPLIQKKLRVDEAFKAKYEKFAEEVGYKPDAGQLAKEMSYVFMNKIVFYKVLERHYKELGTRKLKPISAPDAKAYLNALYSFFSKAVEVTGDFEPVFYTGIYDEIEIPDDTFVFEGINAFMEDMEHHRLEDLGSDIVGFIYEELIPAGERHALGQFYTPPAIAELITRWAVRKPDDRVLDPGCGSGTFLVKAYGRLLDLKGYREPTERVHKEILGQLYAFDINPFPLHLTSLNLASRYIRAPSTEVNTIHIDFFRITPVQRFVTPYVIKTPAGEIKREIPIPKFDAIIANPPYTRWTEIPEKTREAIKDSIGKLLTEYGLTAQVQRGVEPGIYLHFIMHGFGMLKEGGRLGMIISDSWLQTDYGVDFGRFLLDNFKVKALIDISTRVFPVPLIGTCIILLEKCTNQKEKENNQTVFMYADISEGETFKVDEILEAIKNPEKYEERYLIRSVKQGDIAKEQKWINLLFDANAILDKLRKKTVEMAEFFEPSRGNTTYSYLASRGKVSGTKDLGAKDFFYLDESKLQRHGLKDYAYPALTSARYAKWFTFTKQDWERLKKKGSPCYFFMCHEPRDKLPKNVLDYIKWGETECRTMIRGTRGGGKIASQALACQAREKSKEHFYGWYDLGGVEKAPIMAVYQSRYKTRFIMSKDPIVTYHAMITFIPKTELNELQLKALLTYLNSSFPQLYIESVGRTTGAVGPIGLEVKHAEKIPILNVRKLKQKDLELLASLFDELDAEARKIGGADTSGNVETLWETIIEKIDMEITRILKLPKELVKSAKIMAKTMMKRRVQRAEEATPEAIKGEEEPRIRPPKKPEKTPVKDTSVPLDRFIR